MKVEISDADFGDVQRAIARSHLKDVASAGLKMEYCVLMSQYVWAGKVNGEIACAFGVIPPSLLSDQAYLWSLATDVVDEHQFVFIRHSQRMIEMIHEEFALIVGHVDPQNSRARKWLKWLGATFGEIEPRGMPFQIRRKQLNG